MKRKYKIQNIPVRATKLVIRKKKNLRIKGYLAVDERGCFVGYHFGKNEPKKPTSNFWIPSKFSHVCSECKGMFGLDIHNTCKC